MDRVARFIKMPLVSFGNIGLSLLSCSFRTTACPIIVAFLLPLFPLSRTTEFLFPTLSFPLFGKRPLRAGKQTENGSREILLC